MVETLFWLSLLLLIPTGLGSLGPSPGPNGHETLPFDSLSAEERDAAIETALQSHLVAVHLSDHFEIVGAALNTDKHRFEVDPFSRHADFWFYDYGNDHTVWGTVDLTKRSVVHVQRTDAFQPPLTAPEIERSGQLARAHEMVQDRLEMSTTEWTARLWTGTADSACPSNRCALVAFYTGDGPILDWFVVVNLSQGSVETIVNNDLEMEQGGRKGDRH